MDPPPLDLHGHTLSTSTYLVPTYLSLSLPPPSLLAHLPNHPPNLLTEKSVRKIITGTGQHGTGGGILRAYVEGYLTRTYTDLSWSYSRGVFTIDLRSAGLKGAGLGGVMLGGNDGMMMPVSHLERARKVGEQHGPRAVDSKLLVAGEEELRMGGANMGAGSMGAGSLGGGLNMNMGHFMAPDLGMQQMQAGMGRMGMEQTEHQSNVDLGQAMSLSTQSMQAQQEEEMIERAIEESVRCASVLCNIQPPADLRGEEVMMGMAVRESLLEQRMGGGMQHPQLHQQQMNLTLMNQNQMNQYQGMGHPQMGGPQMGGDLGAINNILEGIMSDKVSSLGGQSMGMQSMGGQNMQSMDDQNIHGQSMPYMGGQNMQYMGGQNMQSMGNPNMHMGMNMGSSNMSMGAMGKEDPAMRLAMERSLAEQQQQHRQHQQQQVSEASSTARTKDAL